MTPDVQAYTLPPFPRMPTDRDLPYSDGEPLETGWHHDCMTLLWDSLEYHWRDRKDFFVGGDMFLYFSPEQVFNKDFRGPDLFVVQGVDHDKKRFSYVAWQEDSRLPCVIIELGSPSTLTIDRGEKKALYETRLQTPEYFIYDPEEPRLEGWRLTRDAGYAPLELEPGTRMWSKELELYVGVWEGPYHSRPDRFLRFFDVHGTLIPTGHEAEAAGRAAEAKARAAAERRATAEAKARTVAEERAAAAEAELARLEHELATLRQPPRPEDRP